MSLMVKILLVWVFFMQLPFRYRHAWTVAYITLNYYIRDRQYTFGYIGHRWLMKVWKEFPNLLELHVYGLGTTEWQCGLRCRRIIFSRALACTYRLQNNWKRNAALQKWKLASWIIWRHKRWIDVYRPYYTLLL